MTMSCPEGGSYQCSGRVLIRIENGVALTSSGVQAYGRSTSDLRNPIPDVTTATGLALASGGFAEIRVNKSGSGIISNPAMLLSNLGLSWDAKIDRPLIIETFRTTQGRDQIDGNGLLTFGALPARSNLTFYDWATRRTAGTQANYANNRYFPRSEPVRCGTGTSCPTVETTGIQNQTGNWRAGGAEPDMAYASRLHGDGDIHSGDGPPDANGNPTVLEGGNGPGVPFPGSKGYRQFNNWGYQYANIAAWVTQDTVTINEWTASSGIEHNKNRRGFVAFGNVTAPGAVPASGSSSYAGVVYGWYVRNGTEDAAFFRGTATATVNYATRQVAISIQNAVTTDGSGRSVPVALNSTVMMGATGANVANYLTGAASNGTLAGGISGRYFGPVVTTGSSGAGPAEIAGSFSLSASGTGAVAVGGFITKKN
jgi:hypothetical protein